MSKQSTPFDPQRYITPEVAEHMAEMTTCPQCGKSIKATDRMQAVVLYEEGEVWFHAVCVRLARRRKEPLKINK